MNDLIESLIHKLSQQQMDVNAPPMDPNSIQQGQTIYDEQGDSFTVAENDPMKPEMVLVQEGQDPVNGVNTVENQEVSNRFTVQDNLDPSNPDPNAVVAKIHSSFTRKKSSPGLISDANINPIAPFEITQQNHTASNPLDTSFDTTNLDLKVDFPEFEQNPQKGYTEIKRLVQNLVFQGFSDTDIMLLVGEEFEKTFAERVLKDLKARGEF